MKILITGLRYPHLHNESSAERMQVGRVGLVTGNAHAGFKFSPEGGLNKLESYDLVHFIYKKLK